MKVICFAVLLSILVIAGCANEFKTMSDEQIKEMAISQKDVSICNNIKINSKDRCTSSVAVALKDDSICEQINDIYIKDACLVSIFKIDESNIRLCDKMDFGAPECYSTLALKNLDLNICDKIKDDSVQKPGCYFDIAKAKSDESTCDNIDTFDESKNILNKRVFYKCKIWFAIKSKDIKKCEQIVDKESKEECFSGLARSIKDVSVCDKIEKSSVFFNDCILNVAGVMMDKTICETSTSTEAKESCNEYVESKSK